jgi:hypothetical protein
MEFDGPHVHLCKRSGDRHQKARVSLNLPASLKAAAEDYAERGGVSLNQFIASALAEMVGAFSASEFFSQRAEGANRDRALRFLARRRTSRR